MHCFNHFRLLMWKNILIQLRHPVVTFFEIFIPCFIVGVFAWLRCLANIREHNAVTFKSFGVMQNPRFYDKSSVQPRYLILYSPDNDGINEIMKEFLRRLHDIYKNDFKEYPFKTEEDLETNYKYNPDLSKNKTIFCAIIFETKDENLGKELKYKIRFPSIPPIMSKDEVYKSWQTELTYPVLPEPGPRDGYSNAGETPGYYQEGFLLVQHLISICVASYRAQITNNSNFDENMFDVRAQRFPYPPYIEDTFIPIVQFLFPIVIMFSFIYPFVSLTKNLVLEKEKRLKESMKMMGLQNWLHWMAWFVKSMLWLTISICIIVMLICVELCSGLAVINYSDWSLIFVFFILYVISVVTFSFMLSTLFNKSNIAGVASGAIFFLCLLPYSTLQQNYIGLSLTEKLSSSLLSNSAMGFGINIITRWEAIQIGAQWSNLTDPTTPDDDLSFLAILAMFVVDTIIYLIIMWYVENVFPGEFGIPLKWYFPFTKTYWCGEDKKPQSDDSSTPDRIAKNFEAEPKDLKSGIQIKNLSKSFDGGTTYAVKNLNLNIYKSQITSLLGHNGAGKTTTMSMLTGLFPPTKGTAIVNGHDICEDINGVRSSLGICSQFDVLFDELTVEEHLFFYCKLKNFNSKLIVKEIRRFIKLLGLEDKRKAKSKTLSGGQKRKLSVGIALAGGSKIVILDEPTSGMDVLARRFTWDLLLGEKKNRTILLSTHFMEEADVLGDRIAIMANGELQCCGSPLFLKKRYGAGYYLTIVKKDSLDVSQITKVVQKHIPNATLETTSATEVCYSLPNKDSSKFEDLFKELENDKSKLGIESYGVSITTMEEVFLKVGEYAEKGIKDINKSKNSEAIKKKHIPHNSGCDFASQQFRGLLIKKLLYIWRNPIMTATQILLPPAIILFFLLMLANEKKPGDSPELKLNLDKFKGTDTPYFVEDGDNSGFTRNFSDKYKLSFDKLDNEIHEVVGKRGQPINESAVQYLKKLGEADLSKTNLHTPISLIIDNNNQNSSRLTITALFNNQAFHTPAIALAFVDKAIMKLRTNNPNYKLEVSNHPLPRTPNEEMKQSQSENGHQFQIALNVMFALSFLVASFSVMVVRERSSKFKHLQLVCGLRLFLYWSSMFLCDFVIYMIPCLLIMMLFLVFDEEGLSTANQQSLLLLLFFVHGLAILPFVYAISFMFDVPSTAFVRICLYVIILGMASFMTVFIVELLGNISLAETLDIIFSLLLPVHSLGRGIYHLCTNYNGHKICQTKFEIGNQTMTLLDLCDVDGHIYEPHLICCKGRCKSGCVEWDENYLSWKKPGIGRILVVLLIQAIIYWIIIIIIEYEAFTYIKYKICACIQSPPKDSKSEKVDEDVKAEEKRIETTPLSQLFKSDALIIKNLTKYYGSVMAVNNISYGVKRGECFGLLGVNGAGKTTTFKMITGDETISSGDIYVNGYSVKDSIQNTRKQIGYCPQFEGLLDQLTGKETLTLFCRLRGIKESHRRPVIRDISKLLYFDEHINKLVGKYSGGTKRKLSTAIALLGDPSVSFLDEPTTGVDPVSRRCLWDALTKELSKGVSIVLTSHSMEECEALCNRLIIMVNGKICCIGSPQQLKNKFGKGYTVMIKVANEKIDQLKAFMSASFPGSQLESVHNNLLHYQINDETLSWSKIFGAIEASKKKLEIEDYSIGQSTLEQIFLSFAQKQRKAPN